MLAVHWSYFVGDCRIAAGHWAGVQAPAFFFSRLAHEILQRSAIPNVAAGPQNILDACRRAMAKVHGDGTLLYPDAEGFLASPSNSIDYAVMEGASQLIVVPVDPGWSDVGGWAALYELGAKDENGNVHLGDVVALDTHGNYVRAAPGKRVSIAGLSDLVVVVEGDDILILPRARAQDVRAITQIRANRGESGT